MLNYYLETFYEWEKWTGIMHNVLLLLIIYIIYLFITNNDDRNMTNILLFTIIIAIDILIHQNINIRNNKKTTYL